MLPNNFVQEEEREKGNKPERFTEMKRDYSVMSSLLLDPVSLSILLISSETCPVFHKILKKLMCYR